jgi:hypothetical protein
MDTNTNTKPATLKTELAFTNNATIKVDHVELIEREKYREHEAINQSLIKKVLEHGMHAGCRIYAENELTDDILLGRYYHSVCAGDDIYKTYMIVPKIDKRTKEGKAEWARIEELSRTQGLTPVPEPIAQKAHALALDAFKLMRALNPAGGAKPTYELSLAAHVTVSDGETTIKNFQIKGQLDYVEVLNSGRVFVGDYKTAPQCTEVAVRRKSRDSNWPLQAYTYTLLASAYYNMPAECTYVVSSKDHMTHRAYDISQPSLDEGERALIQGIYRMHFQTGADESYLWRTAL